MALTRVFIQVPNDMLEPSQTLEGLISEVNGDFAHRHQDKQYMSERTILTLTNRDVDSINDMIMQSFPGEVAFSSKHCYPKCFTLAHLQNLITTFHCMLFHFAAEQHLVQHLLQHLLEHLLQHLSYHIACSDLQTTKTNTALLPYNVTAIGAGNHPFEC